MALTKIPNKNITTNTPDEFRATWKKHEIHIERETESERIGKEFYIQVISPDGCYSYDGWWGDDRNSMPDAVAEALKGSLLA